MMAFKKTHQREMSRDVFVIRGEKIKFVELVDDHKRVLYKRNEQIKRAYFGPHR